MQFLKFWATHFLSFQISICSVKLLILILFQLFVQINFLFFVISSKMGTQLGVDKKCERMIFPFPGITGGTGENHEGMVGCYLF